MLKIGWSGLIIPVLFLFVNKNYSHPHDQKLEISNALVTPDFKKISTESQVEVKLDNHMTKLSAWNLRFLPAYDFELFKIEMYYRFSMKKGEENFDPEHRFSAAFKKDQKMWDYKFKYRLQFNYDSEEGFTKFSDYSKVFRNRFLVVKGLPAYKLALRGGVELYHEIKSLSLMDFVEFKSRLGAEVDWTEKMTSTISFLYEQELETGAWGADFVIKINQSYLF